jgi:hypothetical protein
MTFRQTLYLILAIAGLVGTWYFNLQAFNTMDMALENWLAIMYASPIAASLSNDLMIAFVTFLVFVAAEGVRLGMKHWWIYLVLGCLVAFAFAFPLFLLMRERKLQATNS